MLLRSCFILVFVFAAHRQGAIAQSDAKVDTSAGDTLVTEYFRRETKKLTESTLAEIKTLEDWESRRGEYRRQLFEMLGLDPLPQRTPLEAKVTGTTEHEDFIVENLHFQSRPGLYVTANLYRPAEQSEPLPAVLYVCGHGRVAKDGISYGNKVHYHHHGAWFARNGYVCLTIDTIQLGEIEGIHHGTYREKMWWWNNRGYTPAGVEAWNCIRSLDYLQSREEVDGDRMGVTGRSGGGAYSWWIAALDDRIKAAVPVAGITSLHNHVVDGCVEGHCDCMYMVNTYRWDYPLVAALVAPRPLLISNTDKDRIFPLDGVVDVHSRVRRIYDLYDAGDKLGLHITEGPHKDTQELRVHAFRWMNRFLKSDQELIENVAEKYFEPEQLRVFQTLPNDQRVTDIHESFVPAVARDLPSELDRDALMKLLKERTFRGWPRGYEVEDLDVKVVAAAQRDGVVVKRIQYTSQSPYRLTMHAISPLAGASNSLVTVFDQPGWEAFKPVLATAIPDEFAGTESDEPAWQELARLAKTTGTTFVYLTPRGVGPTQWSRDERARTHIRRRFMQLGQTAAGMQIWDVRRALQALDRWEQLAGGRRILRGSGEAALWSLYASLFEDRISQLSLEDLPTSNRTAPDLLNISRFAELTHLLSLASEGVGAIHLHVQQADADAWAPVDPTPVAASPATVPSTEKPTLPGSAEKGILIFVGAPEDQ